MREILTNVPENYQEDRFNFIILDSLIQYVDVFINKKTKKMIINLVTYL